MSYAPTRHGNPCIHCGDFKGKCRTHKTREMHLCAELAGSKKGEKSQGYVVIGDEKLGRWSQLLPDTEEEFTSEKIRERKLEWQHQENLAKQNRLAGEMPVVDRNKYNRGVLAELTLNPEDKADLLRRGMTEEQIVKSNFRSVGKWQKLSKIYPGNLPGLNPRGDGLLTHSPGSLIPITNADGQVVGWQVRKRNLAEGESDRFYHLSTNSNIRVNDELPLGVFPSDHSSKIALVEGLGVKPFLACERLGVSVIGASGGQHASSPSHLQDSLTKLKAKPSDEIIIIPDAGSVSNPSVVRQYVRTVKVLQSLGYIPVFAWWSQVDKSFGDIDELPPERLADIHYLSVDEFKALCVKWRGIPGQDLKAAPTNYSERVAEAQKRLHSLSYAADLICDPLQKYLPDLPGKIPTSGLVCIKSPKGSGKSRQIKLIKDLCCGYWSEKTIHPEAPELPPEQLDLFAKFQQVLPAPEPIIERVWNLGRKMKFISIIARVALGREQGVRWEFTYIEDVDTEGKGEFAGEKLATRSVIENIDEIGLCADSLAKLKHRDWSNTLVVFDETELDLNHIVTSSTCREKRSEILQVIADKSKECLDNGGLIICADADLTDISVNYFKAIAPNHVPFVVKHDFKGDPWQVKYYTDKRDIVLRQIESHLEDPDCEPIIVAVDNQKEAESLSIHLIRKYPYLGKEKGGLIRIDSKETQQDFGREFVKRPNEGILKYLPKILIHTPSLGVGCSLDVHYFRHVYGLFFGTIEPSQCRQMLGRVRQPVPRTVWCKERGGRSENESTSYLPEEIKRRTLAYHDTAIFSLEQILAEAKALAKASGIENPENKDIYPAMIEIIQGMQNADGSWNNPHIDLYCEQTARRNFSLSQLAVQLRQELIEEGHNIIDEEGDETNNTGDAVTAGKEEIKRRDATLTAIAEDIPFEDAQELRRKAARTTEEEHKVNKAFLKHDLPELEITPEFVYKAVHKDNGSWLTETKLYWHLQNPEALAHKDEKHWKSKLLQFSKGVTCLWDVRTDAPKIEAIIKSGVLDWIKSDDFEAEYSSESDGGQNFLKKALASKKTIKTALGFTVKDDIPPIKLANRLLERLGLKLAYYKKNNKIKYYKLDEESVNDPDRQAVFNALNLKWKNEATKIAETHAQIATNGATEQILLSKNEVQSYENKPEELVQNPVAEGNTEDWTTPEKLADAAVLLGACEDSEMLAGVRAIVPDYGLKAACKSLLKPRLIQIKQWVLRLNSILNNQTDEAAIIAAQSELQVADAAALLGACESSEMLADLRDCFFDSVIIKASELVPASLKQWVQDCMDFWQTEERYALAQT
ncbi:MAG: hypothetical protein KME38_20555 [Spirirestis rafaelensis WJT71-NPBG6]|nr:hypothetical protein [Spirirestis rafaelensis WJT71-NPBG6]